MLCRRHDNPGGHKSCGQGGVGLTQLPRLFLNPLSEVGLSTLSRCKY